MIHVANSEQFKLVAGLAEPPSLPVATRASLLDRLQNICALLVLNFREAYHYRNRLSASHAVTDHKRRVWWLLTVQVRARR